ncbi:MAG TPA: branched-chain amino acid ABC transporter permease [Trueperaceae bacterium]
MLTPLILAKSVLLAIPLAFLAGLVLPLRAVLRVPLAILAGWLLAVLVQLVLGTGFVAYLASFAVLACVYAVLSLGLNVQWGYTGLFNIGIAAFFAVGAFTSALFTTAMPTGPIAAFTQQAFGLEMPFLVGVLAAGVVAGLLAWLVGIPTLRLREDYLAIATIGIAEVVRLIFQNERWLANGPQPLRGIPQPLTCLLDEPVCSWLPGALQTLFSPLDARDYSFVYLAIVTLFVVVIYLILERMLRSPWGRVLRAVREDEASAEMSGKDAASFRMQAFVVGAIVMGMGGALYAHYLISIDYSHFNPLYATFLIWVMLMLGGSGNNRGAVLGAFAIWAVWSGTVFVIDDLMRPVLASISPELAARAPYLRYLFIALLLLAILLYRPKGILEEEKTVSRVARE